MLCFVHDTIQLCPQRSSYFMTTRPILIPSQPLVSFDLVHFIFDEFYCLASIFRSENIPTPGRECFYVNDVLKLVSCNESSVCVLYKEGPRVCSIQRLQVW